MIQVTIQNAVQSAVQTLPGFDAGEREWIRVKVLSHLSDLGENPCVSRIPHLVRQWAQFLVDREEPIGEGELDAAVDIALQFHGKLTPEEGLYCRNLVRKAAATEGMDLETIGDVADFITFALMVLQNASTDISMLHHIADCRAGSVRFALMCKGHPGPSDEEMDWLRGEIFADFVKPEFSPFEEKQAAWFRHVDLLAKRLQRRREGVAV